MIGTLTRPLLRPLLRPLVGKGGCERWVYNFDGVDDYGQFAEPVPLTSDYVIEITVNSSDWRGTTGRRIFGTLTSLPNRSFFRYEAGNQVFQFAANFSAGSSVFLPFAPVNDQDYSFRIARVDGEVTLTELSTGQFATTTNTADGVIDIFGGHLANRFLGVIRDLRINGQLYPINNPNSNIQTSVPDNGNPLTLINTNPERWSKIKC